MSSRPTASFWASIRAGLADRTVPVLRVEGADGKPLAVLFGAATHNTTLGPDNYQICGDYAGFAQAYVEEKYPKVQAMFLLGCAGDSNPYPRGTMDLAETRPNAGGRGVSRSGRQTASGARAAPDCVWAR